MTASLHRKEGLAVASRAMWILDPEDIAHAEARIAHAEARLADVQSALDEVRHVLRAAEQVERTAQKGIGAVRPVAIGVAGLALIVIVADALRRRERRMRDQG